MRIDTRAGADAVERRLVIDQPTHYPFDLAKILDGTQDFRWRPWKDDWHSGILGGNLIHIRQIGRAVEYRADSDLNALLSSYFRLDDDIDAIYADISSRDDKAAKLVKEYPYLRILRQPDAWECTVAYICSATNNVNRISTIVEKVAERLGHPVELDGEVRHTFPTPETVLEAGARPLEKLYLVSCL